MKNLLKGGLTKEWCERHRVPLLVLVAVTFLVFARALGHEFLFNWDDNLYVTENPAIRGFGWDHLRTIFTSFYGGNYAPIQMLSYLIDYSIWGVRPAGFILTNILLHTCNGLLFYHILIMLGSRRWWALLAASIFLLHPVQVESVVWIAQRKNLLAMTFFLLALIGYLLYRARGWADGRAFYIASLVAFVLALLSKSVVVILPVVLLTHDLCFVQQESRRRWLLDKLPYLAVAAAVALLTIISQSPELAGGRTGYHGGSPFATFLTMLPVLLRYLSLLVWPADLSALYMPEVKTAVDLAVVSAALVLLLLGCLAVYLWHRQRALLFWLALFFIGLLPVAQIVPMVTLMNDRYLYFPMLGVAGLVGGWAALVSDQLQGKAKIIFAFVVCLLLLPLPYITMERVAVWQDPLTLWSETARKVPDCHVAWSNLGEAYQQVGNRDAAFQAYLNALAIDPDYREPLENIALIFMGRGEPLKARPFLFKLVESWPNYAAGFVTLGNNYYLTGEFKEAQQAYQLALQKQPTSPLALVSLARLHLRLGDPAMARIYYQKGVSGGVTDPAVAYVAAAVVALDGRQPAALHYLETALQLGFNDFDQLRNDHDLDQLRATAEFKQLVRLYSSERTHK